MDHSGKECPVAPMKIEDTFLVLQGFKDNGVDYQPEDRQ